MSETFIFQTNDLVWAKMKGFSPWPGMIVEPPSELKKAPKKNCPSQCIFFFGSKNYAWIEEPNIKPYLAYREELIKTSKSAAFREAVDQINAYMDDPEKWKADNEVQSDAEAQFNKLRENTEIIESPVSPRKPQKKKSVKNKLNESKSLPPSKRKRISSIRAENHDDILLNDSEYLSPSGSRRNASVAAQFINRPSTVPRPESTELDMSQISQTLRSKNIRPSQLKFGFLGLGIMGSGIVKNLINSGHSVIVWNRTFAKCQKFELAGAKACATPSDVVDCADIIFACVSDPQAAKDMVFGNCGVLQSVSVGEGKGYVEMTSIDAETSQDISDAIISKGGRFLEAQIQGSKLQAEEGTLVILAAGERSLFDECQTCFEAMSKNSFYLGGVGNASKMNLVLQVMAGINLAGLGESMALADRAGLQLKDVLEVLELTNMASHMILEKGKAMIKSDFPTQLPLTHMQKDLKLAIGMADNLEHPLPLTATTNEVFKHAKRLGYAEHDASAVFVRARF